MQPEEALATVGVVPARIHVETLNDGSEWMASGVVGAATRAPHLPQDDANHWSAGSFGAVAESPQLEGIGLPCHVLILRCVRRPGPLVCNTQKLPRVLSQLRGGVCPGRHLPALSARSRAAGDVLLCCSAAAG